MPITVDWFHIVLRLALTAVAGAVLGIDRAAHGRAAGLRTTMLVSLAACVAMIEANLLLDTAGKPPTSFVTLDLMRFPLGILSGIGFIGAGAIIHRDNLVIGVTTAATLWFATVIGLCFGGGLLGFGAVSTAFGVGVLSGLKQLEPYLPQEFHAILTLVAGAEAEIGEPEIREVLRAAGFRVAIVEVTYCDQAQRRELRWDVRSTSTGAAPPPPAFLGALARQPGIVKLAWTPRFQAGSRGGAP